MSARTRWLVVLLASFASLVFVAACGDDDGLDPIPAPEDVAGPPDDATTTASGLSYKVLSLGAGEQRPTAEDVVTVHYTGWTTDGEMFDSSVARGEPATFPVDALIQGWVEGMQLMREGDEYRFWIPQRLAYQGRDGFPQGTLVFDVELIDVLR